MIEAPHEPCSYCGVRADVGCKHRPPSGPPPQTFPEKADRRKGDTRRIPGLAFHPERRTPDAVKRAADKLFNKERS